MAKRKRLSVRPVEVIELEFPDGTVKEAVFTVQTFLQLNQEFGDLSELALELEDPSGLVAKLLYCGMKTKNQEVTLEEAEGIVLGGGLPLMQAILDEAMAAFGDLDDLDGDDLKKKVQEQLQNLLAR